MNSSADCVVAVASFMSSDLAADEAIVEMVQGQTAFSRNTQLYYRLKIVTFGNLSGNDPMNARQRVVSVSSNSPHQVAFAADADWVALVYPPSP